MIKIGRWSKAGSVVSDQELRERIAEEGYRQFLRRLLSADLIPHSAAKSKRPQRPVTPDPCRSSMFGLVGIGGIVRDVTKKNELKQRRREQADSWKGEKNRSTCSEGR